MFDVAYLYDVTKVFAEKECFRLSQIILSRSHFCLFDLKRASYLYWRHVADYLEIFISTHGV